MSATAPTISLSDNYRPDIVTKNLALGSVKGSRKVRLSTNFLPLMGFAPDTRIQTVPNGKLNGFRVVPVEEGPLKVYQRRYASRNNPLEAVMEFGGQRLINQAFPAYTERFHVEMRDGEVVFSPLANRVHAIHQRFKKSDPLRAFVALTGGVDVVGFKELGWKTEVILEHRPQEARDIAAKRDLTEVNALNAMAHGQPSILLNEDLYHVDMSRLERIFADAPPIACAHFSLGCDDFSVAKGKKDKEASLEDLSSMIDLVYPMLKSVEVAQPGVVVIENVPQFANSAAGQMAQTVLRRMGYHVTTSTLNALDYGATQRRVRCYMVASIWPGYEAPEPTGANETPLRDIILKHLPDCRDITETGLLAARERKSAKGRKPPPNVTVDSLFCPTILKSQSRGITDATYIEHDGRLFAPSPGLLKALMSIPDSYNPSWMAKEQQVESLGQSVDFRLHDAVLQSITRHIKTNIGRHTLVRHTA